MDWRGMNIALDYLASTGTVFSVEQRVGIQSSLTCLQQDNKFNHVHFLGKICGTESDYYLVCGIGKDYLKDRTYFYSINRGIDWVMIPLPNAATVELGMACRGHFVGDPTTDVDTDIAPNNEDEIAEGDDWVGIKEEERLAATISAIMNEAAVVPRGALIKSPSGLVTANRMFEGIPKVNATQFHSYYHLRRPENPWDRNIVVRADYNLALDFLDSIAIDIPLGCWGIQTDSLETTIYARNLYWPGFVAYHVMDTPSYGFLYVGTGKKNWDVPFMILPPPRAVKVSVVEGGGDFQFDDMGKETDEMPGEGGDFPYESGPDGKPYVPQEIMDEEEGEEEEFDDEEEGNY